MKAMYQFLAKNTKYPETARHVDGTVYIGFVVNKDGSLTDVKVKRGVHPDIDSEAVRVVKLMSGYWKAGIQNGQPERISFTLPIKFRLESEQTVQKQDSILPPPPPIACGTPEPNPNEQGVFWDVEERPQFIGGHKAMHQLIKDSLRYPMVAKENEIQGTVYVGCIVETDGQLTDITVKRGIEWFNKEAVRLVHLMSGKFTTGKQMGKPVRTAYTIPIKFKLE
jgi:TonB family protein